MSSLTRTAPKTVEKAAPGLLRSLDWMLLIVTLALSGFGIFAVYVAGGGEGQGLATSQGMGFIAGLAGAIPLALINYRIWQRHLRWIYIAVVLMLVVVIVMGAAAGGAQRWIDLGPVRVQPSEFAKLGVVVVLAGYFAERHVGDGMVFVKSIAIIALPAFLVFVQPDLGTALVFAAVFVLMTFTAGARLWQLAMLALATVVGAVVVIKFKILKEYQMDRLTVFLDPEGSGDVGYQVAQSKTAIGSGGLTGKGIDANTLSNLGFLPENHTDFIFSNLGEQLGFVGCGLLLLLFFVLIWRILHIATISRDRFGVLLAVGVATIFLFHVFVNVGMTMGIMPVTGIPLPFISYGRSSLVVSVISLGLLQSVAMRARSEAARHQFP
ncbi:MAG: rod shape-determining protein RodA [Rubrobacteraceae bacterium]